MHYTEIEQKYALSDTGALISRLGELGATPSEPSRQVDAYYNHPARDFLASTTITEWVRFRSEERGSSFKFQALAQARGERRARHRVRDDGGRHRGPTPRVRGPGLPAAGHR